MYVRMCTSAHKMNESTSYVPLRWRSMWYIMHTLLTRLEYAKRHTLTFTTATLYIDSNQCMVNNGNCSQTCTDLLPGHLCSCTPGFYLDEDKVTCNGTSLCVLGCMPFRIGLTSLFCIQMLMSAQWTMEAVTIIVWTLKAVTLAIVTLVMIWWIVHNV